MADESRVFAAGSLRSTGTRALSQAKVRVEAFAGKGGQVPKMQSTLRAVPVFDT